MTIQKFPARSALLAAALLSPLLASATNGYFSNGYGARSQGAGGVGIALAQDSLAAAANPAGTAAVGDRIDLGLTWFCPSRGANFAGNAFGSDASYSGDQTKNFFIPDFGYVRKINSSTSIGVAVYGNGGLNTDYASNPYARFGASGTAGVNLEQLLITPSLAYKVSENHTVGVALNLAYQRFEAKGVGFFAGFSAAPGNVSDQGVDSSTGAGVRLGWTGKLAPGVTLGATWASRISGKFEKYKGLFADGGNFDIPENYGVGIAVEATPQWTIAADVQTIRYSQTPSVGNPVANLFAKGQPLGSANGPGFGWKDVTAFKLGAIHQVNKDLTLRGGLSFASQTVPESETFFNVLAPGVIRKHLSLGATWNLGGGELSGFYSRAFGETVNGSGSIPAGFPPAGFGGGNVSVRLEENIVGLAYGWKF
jgi:long-chain fatty acid transport protein